MLPRMEGEALSVPSAADRPGVSRSGLLDAFRRVLDPVLLGTLPFAIGTALVSFQDRNVSPLARSVPGALWASAPSPARVKKRKSA